MNYPAHIAPGYVIHSLKITPPASVPTPGPVSCPQSLKKKKKRFSVAGFFPWLLSSHFNLCKNFILCFSFFFFLPFWLPYAIWSSWTRDQILATVSATALGLGIEPKSQSSKMLPLIHCTTAGAPTLCFLYWPVDAWIHHYFKSLTFEKEHHF